MSARVLFCAASGDRSAVKLGRGGGVEEEVEDEAAVAPPSSFLTRAWIAQRSGLGSTTSGNMAWKPSFCVHPSTARGFGFSNTHAWSARDGSATYDAATCAYRSSNWDTSRASYFRGSC
eukprot:8672605-Pyramimonas_sp.AAC.1